MKAWMVFVKFKDDSAEGVVFTNEGDADEALNGATSGSALAFAFHNLYGEYDDPKPIKVEIQI